MNFIDSSAWLSYFAGDGNASVFAKHIENIAELLVPSVTITEVFKAVLRQRGEEAALIVTAQRKVPDNNLRRLMEETQHDTL